MNFYAGYHEQRPYNLETIKHALPAFWVIAVVSNPVRYKTRYQLFMRFLERIKRAEGINLYIVEVQQGEREFVCTDSKCETHLQMRTRDELWIKENMINLAIENLMQGAGYRATGVIPRYVAWIDADIYFEHETTWHYETLHQLQTYDIVQMWETAVDLGPNGEIISEKPHTSFMSCYRKYGAINYQYGGGSPSQKANLLDNPYYGSYGDTYPDPKDTKKEGPYYHPGFAWAARLDSFSKIGLMIDRAIIGSGDYHLAMSCIGLAQKSVPADYAKQCPYYLEMVLDYQRKVQRVVEGRVGYVPGSIYHWFHGKKKQRKYWQRWDCLRDKKDEDGRLIEAAYDPFLDVFSDAQGLLQLDGEKPLLRDQLHDYFRNRHEDSIDLD